jgi:class 3 adenylate cyclase/tetratricopeptide (TPR) repeat protein
VPAHRCPACRTDNPAGSRFCRQCGATLGAAPSSAREPGAYTPKHLAEKILSSRSALEGERKQVTVLFADVKGSMDLAEQLDPEAWHRIMDRFLQLLADGVHRFEGTVNQYTGDGIMALFGAPIAHEDHAQRACWAALSLRDELRRYAQDLRRERGLDFAVRMGLNSGEVVVGRIGDDLRMDYTAHGHTVGLAQRMEQLAEAGRIYLTADTAALVTGFFRLEDLGEFTVKGASAPLNAFALEGAGTVQTRFDAARARGLSRFVGRTDETVALEAALAAAVDGRAQVVGVVGEPGVGKSRLCHELTERARARGFAVHAAHCVAHGKMIPLLPVLELMRGFFGITPQDDDETARRKIAGLVVRLDKAVADELPLVFDFLGVADPADPPPRMSPDARQRRLGALFERLMRARSRREPAVVVLEDLHWIDGASAPFVEMLVDSIPGTRTLLVVNFRPEYEAPWMQRPHYRGLPLAALGPEAVAELLADLLGADASLAGVATRILERTGGNPFFVEETVQALAETGALAGTKGTYRLVRPLTGVVLPATVQAVLSARIDRLPEGDKEVLQTAAVIGKEFSEPVLRGVTALPEADLAAALRALVAGEFLDPVALYPEAEYAFRHPLTREVAYRSQLGERRARTHAATARVVETADRAKLGERAALLAHHWESAGEPQTAAEWHRRAAEWVGPRDREEMLRHWRRVRTLLDPVPESPETIALGFLARLMILHNGLLAGLPDAEIEALFAEGVRLAARTGDPTAQVRILTVYGIVRALTGAPAEGKACLEEARGLADRSGDVSLRLNVLSPLATALLVAGRLEDAVKVAEEAEALCGDDYALEMERWGFAPYVTALTSHVDALAMQGELAAAARVAEHGIEVARRLGDREGLAFVLARRATVHSFAGDPERALAAAREAVTITEALGRSPIRAFALEALAFAHMAEARWPDAIAALEAALDFDRPRVGTALGSRLLGSLAEAHRGAGDVARAREAADLAVATARRGGAAAMEVQGRLAQARVLLASDGAAAEIEATLDAAATLVDATGARFFTPLIHAERAALARRGGDAAGWRRELEAAHRLFVEMGAARRAEQVALELRA